LVTGIAGEEGEALPEFIELIVELVVDFEEGVIVANGPL